MFLLYPPCLQNFKKKLKINSYLINKMFNIQVQIVDNIWFKWNLTRVLKTERTHNSTIRFSKYTSNKKI